MNSPHLSLAELLLILDPLLMEPPPQLRLRLAVPNLASVRRYPSLPIQGQVLSLEVGSEPLDLSPGVPATVCITEISPLKQKANGCLHAEIIRLEIDGRAFSNRNWSPLEFELEIVEATPIKSKDS